MVGGASTASLMMIVGGLVPYAETNFVPYHAAIAAQVGEGLIVRRGDKAARRQRKLPEVEVFGVNSLDMILHNASSLMGWESRHSRVLNVLSY